MFLIVSLIVYLFVFAYQINENKLNNIRGNNKDVYIKEITNFQWDYAYLYLHNIDFQKIVFFNKNGEIIFAETIKLDREGNILPQYLFDDIKENTLYYKCSYRYGKLKFFRKEQLYMQDGFIYFYQPIDCDAYASKRA